MDDKKKDVMNELQDLLEEIILVGYSDEKIEVSEKEFIKISSEANVATVKGLLGEGHSEEMFTMVSKITANFCYEITKILFKKDDEDEVPQQEDND